MYVDREKPYVGVTGVTSIKEARIIVQAIDNSDLNSEQSSHGGMVGLLASPETFTSRGRKRIKYPSLLQIRKLLQETTGKAFNTIHYNNYPTANLMEQISSLLGYDGLYSDRLCEGIQFNKPSPPDDWIPVQEIDRIKQTYPELKIILQLGPRILRDEQPKAIAEKLASYESLIDYALIDPSGGRKRVFEVNTVSHLYNSLREAFPGLALGFAGGFDAKNLQTRLWLLSQVIGSTDFSIDAEGGLRIKGKDPNLPTPISATRAQRYIYQAASFFRNPENLLRTGS